MVSQSERERLEREGEAVLLAGFCKCWLLLMQERTFFALLLLLCFSFFKKKIWGSNFVKKNN
jgi:hypothetical protein